MRISAPIPRLICEGIARGWMAPRVFAPRSIHRSRLGMAGNLTRVGQLPSGSSRIGAPAVPHLQPTRLPFSNAKGASGGQIYEVVRNTSAAAATPTQQNEFLVGIILEGGGAGGAGAWTFTFDGTHQAQFPVGSSGLDATGAIGHAAEMFYPLNYGPIGTNIPAANQTFTGGLAAVRFIFSNRPNPLGYRISQFAGVVQTGTENGTSGTAKTYTIPGALGKPTGIVALSSVVTTINAIPSAEIDFPAIGNYGAFSVPAPLARGHEIVGYHQWAVPDYDPASSFSLTHKAISVAGGTIQVMGALYYSQALQRVAAA